MKFIEEHCYLSREEIERLKPKVELVQYNSADELVYQGHFPKVAYVLLEGEIELYKGKRKIDTVFPYCLFLARELLENKTVGCSYRVTPGTCALILDKSTLQELIAEKNDVLLSKLEVTA
jgi:CRP-like cAMP-binding protein